MRYGVKLASTEPQELDTHASRRNFLGKLSVGVAALAGASFGIFRLGKSASNQSNGEFPGADSIFHPAQDPRKDPRRG